MSDKGLGNTGHARGDIEGLTLRGLHPRNGRELQATAKAFSLMEC